MIMPQVDKKTVRDLIDGFIWVNCLGFGLFVLFLFPWVVKSFALTLLCWTGFNFYLLLPFFARGRWQFLSLLQKSLFWTTVVGTGMNLLITFLINTRLLLLVMSRGAIGSYISLVNIKWIGSGVRMPFIYLKPVYYGWIIINSVVVAVVLILTVFTIMTIVVEGIVRLFTLRR